MTDFNDFVTASSNRASPAKTDKIPIVIDGSTATGHVTAAQVKLTSEIVLAVSNPASAYTLPKTHALVSITGLDHALTINAPTSGTSGETQGIEVRVGASGADRVITPSGFTIIGAGTTFTVTSGTTEIFYVQWNGSAWEWSGNLTAAKIVNVPAGNIAATTVQAAINELDTEKATTGHTHSGVYEPADTDILKADVGGTMTAGYLSDDYSGGTISSGTYTPAPATGQENFQYIVNGGAFTLAPPAASCSIILQITNNGSAGAITTSGFTKKDGDAFTTTNGDDFMCFIARCNGFSTLTVKALQ